MELITQSLIRTHTLAPSLTHTLCTYCHTPVTLSHSLTHLSGRHITRDQHALLGRRYLRHPHSPTHTLTLSFTKKKWEEKSKPIIRILSFDSPLWERKERWNRTAKIKKLHFFNRTLKKKKTSFSGKKDNRQMVEIWVRDGVMRCFT